MRPRPLNRLLTLLTPTASGTRRAVTALCLVTNLCFLGTPPSLNAEPAQEKPPVPAGAPAPPYVPGRLPYRLKWGSYTVVADVKRDKDGGYDGKQVRVVDARGRTLQQVGSDRVDAVRLVKPLVAGEEGLLVRLSGGNSGLADFHGFGAGAASRFVVSDALDVAVKDLDGDGTAEVAATYRFSDLDGGGEHHGPLVTVVYRWDGKRFAEATKRFPEASRVRAKEYQAQLLASERASTPSQGGAEDKESADKESNDGLRDAVLGYTANARFAGDAVEAGAWLQANIAAEHLRMPRAELDAAALEIRSCRDPLPQQPASAGEDAPHPLPAQQGRAAVAPRSSALPRSSAPHALPHYSITELNLGGGREVGGLQHQRRGRGLRDRRRAVSVPRWALPPAHDAAKRAVHNAGGVYQ